MEDRREQQHSDKQHHHNTHHHDNEHYHNDEHNQDYDHYHDDEHLHGGPVPLEENMLWQMDNIELKSVGIDIGSAGSQVIFSLLKLKRFGEDLSSRYVIVSREVMFQSPIWLTPYDGLDRIDDRQLAEMIDTAYEMAAVTPEQIDTGVVILTGEAIQRDNARMIADLLATHGGDFVCASAGHNMEALLAAYGSGAARLSYDRRCRILNVDIGGGTTKFSVVENGRVLDTAAIYIGGRLLVVDENQRIIRLDSGGAHIAKLLGIPLEAGDVVTAEIMKQLASWMADAVLAVALQQPLASEVASLFLTPPLQHYGKFDGVMFSGGVGEYVYNREDREFGDLGKLLGTMLRRRVDQDGFPWPWLPAGECIRATVVGASEHSVQVSGNTIYISDPAVLPCKNIQVLQPDYDLGGSGPIDSTALAQAIRKHFIMFDLTEGDGQVALAFHWAGEPSYVRISAFINGLVQALPRSVSSGKPIILVFDGDIAQTMGSVLAEERNLKNGIISIDGIFLRDWEFIDIGRVLQPSGNVPVTIKSLLFK